MATIYMTKTHVKSSEMLINSQLKTDRYLLCKAIYLKLKNCLMLCENKSFTRECAF